LIPGLSSP